MYVIVQTDDGDGKMMHVLEVIQNLLQELIVVLSTLDHGNNSQLPHQVQYIHVSTIYVTLTISLSVSPCYTCTMYIYLYFGNLYCTFSML